LQGYKLAPVLAISVVRRPLTSARHSTFRTNMVAVWIVSRSAICSFSALALRQQHRPLLRRIAKEHVSDDARRMLAKKVIEHLELSGLSMKLLRLHRRLAEGFPTGAG